MNGKLKHENINRSSIPEPHFHILATTQHKIFLFPLLLIDQHISIGINNMNFLDFPDRLIIIVQPTVFIKIPRNTSIMATIQRTTM